jgi:Leucine-rich repeat (LRR) protein
MRYVLMVLILLVSALVSAQTTQSPDQIRAQMAKIRQTTNWDDPVAAEKANAEIKKLAKQLMISGSQQSGSGSGAGAGNKQGQISSDDAEALAEINQEMAQQKVDIFSQIWKAAAGGEGADILLAEPLREEIVQEYKEDENNTINPEITEKLDILVLDLSMPGIDAIIDAMPQFKSISTLVIFGGVNRVSLNPGMILENAEDYPLTDLYILGFGRSFTSLPKNITRYKNLKILNLSGNNFESLPPEIVDLDQITELYLNNNPIKTLFPGISQLKNLNTLCLHGTLVPADEIVKIEQLYPECKILIQ